METITQPNFVDDGIAFYQIQGNIQLQEVMLSQFMGAIAAFEGFWIVDPPSISRRHLNPGNLRPVGASTGFQGFTTEAEGWAALRRQVLINIGRGLTLNEFFLGKEGVYPGYSPLGDPGNKPEQIEAYIAFVAKHTRMSREINLLTYFPDLTKKKYLSTLYWGFRL